MWDFILPAYDDEDKQEDLPVSTRSKGPADSTQSTQRKNPPTSTTKDKVANTKSSPKSLQTTSSSSNPPSSYKTLVVSDTMEYNMVEDMKKERKYLSS